MADDTWRASRDSEDGSATPDNSHRDVTHARSGFSTTPLQLHDTGGGLPEEVGARPAGPEDAAGHVSLALDGGITGLAPRTWATGAPGAVPVRWTPAGTERCVATRMDATVVEGEAFPEPRLDRYASEDLVALDAA